jgi:hypothetical protein
MHVPSAHLLQYSVEQHCNKLNDSAAHYVQAIHTQLKQPPMFFVVITPDCSQKVPAKKCIAIVIEIHNLDHAAKKDQVIL